MNRPSVKRTDHRIESLSLFNLSLSLSRPSSFAAATEAPHRRTTTALRRQSSTGDLGGCYEGVCGCVGVAGGLCLVLWRRKVSLRIVGDGATVIFICEGPVFDLGYVCVCNVVYA
ncbi:hypothetical protein HanRHA438_Chr04g0177111 [Helianthus annuus]|nr:hypothetical protein HanIR_Chr04g0180631 [Helianthus annuus]KAJ0926942.1 hypothetical protein HanRHA438_Chr04g0177111 [Helianthus annuus]